MHGGLFSTDDVSLDDIRNIKRNCQPPDSGLMCEILWSDPMDARGRVPSKRGVGCQFGPDVSLAFCNRNDLDYIIRSHEVCYSLIDKIEIIVGIFSTFFALLPIGQGSGLRGSTRWSLCDCLLGTELL